jgi:UDP-N-acetylglucosamine 1-carboxyvinyltransferase
MNIKVKGGQTLSGEITPSGSKNSAVHLIPASILFDEDVVFENVPDITDVDRLVKIIVKMGAEVDWDKNGCQLRINNSKLSFKKLDKEDLGNMKGTSLLWGAFLARFGKVDFSELPGGCTLGIRSLEPIYKVFKDMGVTIAETDKGIKMSMGKKNADEVWLTEMSPTATTNLLFLSVVMNGKTRLIGAASEPQVQDVCLFLQKAGAKISGIGSNVLEIEGGYKLNGVKHKILSDHYEIATFLAMGATTGGAVSVKNAIPQYFKIINHEFSKFNVDVEFKGDTAFVSPNQKIKISGNYKDKTNVVRAQPWPSLPVDLLPIFVPLALAAERGYVIFHNWMYESGLYWTSELSKLGAEIIMADPHRVLVMGGNKLRAATIEAPFIIRAVVSMVITAMLAEGESTILNADALYRGHPHFSENLKRLGAKIEEVG